MEALDVVSTYSTAANELPVSPNAQLTGLLTLPMITSIQDKLEKIQHYSVII